MDDDDGNDGYNEDNCHFIVSFSKLASLIQIVQNKLEIFSNCNESLLLIKYCTPTYFICIFAYDAPRAHIYTRYHLKAEALLFNMV